MTYTNGGAKSQRVATMFSRISRKYDFMNTVMTGCAHKHWRRRAAEIATLGLPPGPALDVATGTGDLAFELAHRPEVSGAVGVDFVAEMLALAHKKEQRLSVKRPIAWLLGDALQLPFPDSTFMCATAGFAMRNVADLRRAISEMARVVRPGGRVVILDLTPSEERHPVSRLLARCFSYLAPLLGHLLAKDREAYTYLPRSVASFPTANELSDLMADAGLINVRWQLLGMGLVALHVGEVTRFGNI